MLNTKRKTLKKHTRKLNYTHVHNKETFIQYLKYLYKSKRKDDVWIKKHPSKGAWTESPEKWHNHTIGDFLEAMLSGVGYDPHVLQYEESHYLDKHPENVWRFMAYMLLMGKEYE